MASFGLINLLKIKGSAYGAGTITGGDGKRPISDIELKVFFF